MAPQIPFDKTSLFGPATYRKHLSPIKAVKEPVGTRMMLTASGRLAWLGKEANKNVWDEFIQLRSAFFEIASNINLELTVTLPQYHILILMLITVTETSNKAVLLIW